MRRLILLSTAALLLMTFAFATPVLAVAPGNDLYAGRTVVGALPFSETLDTTDATTDADDAEANAACGAPATEASVWYEFSPTADVDILIDVSASDYSAGVLVVTGAPGSFSFVTCGPGAVVFSAASGETYSILAFDDVAGGTNGGTLTITIDEAPPPPEINVTVNPVGTFNPRTGSATITGTVTCTEGVLATLQVNLSQRVGRFTVNGFGGQEVLCDGTAQEWSIEVFGFDGLFKGGHAVALTLGVACDGFSCGFDEEETTVRLRR